jgi:Tfp pilus assembly protein PilP
VGKQKISDELSRYDPLVKLDLLKEFEDRPLPELNRNPFEFVAGRVQASPVQTAAAEPAPTPPAPPPPVTLKPMGYSEGKGGVKEAMVSDEDQVFVVHEGDSVGTRYKVIKITPTVITVEDAALHQTVDLPVPP